MRAWLLAIAVAAGTAHADVPGAVAGARVSLLDGQLAMQLVEGSLVESASRASLDWDDARLTIVARDAGVVRASGLRDWIAMRLRAEGQPVVALQPLAVAKPGLAYGATVRAPRVRDGRRLVYVAFAANREGRVSEVQFYLAGADELDAWARVAARVATTMTTSDPLSPVLPPSERLDGACRDLTTWSIDLYPPEARETGVMRSPIGGKTAYWSVWEDDAGSHAETLTDKRHVVCDAPNRMRLYQIVRGVK